MTQDQKNLIKGYVIYMAIVLVVYSMSMLWIYGGHEWAVEKIESWKEKRKIQKENKYVTRKLGAREES